MSAKCGMRNSGGGIAVRGGAAARSAAGAMRRVKFGDVVREVKDKIDRADNPYEFYVAGDHMDTEDLKIRRRGRFATDDVGPAFTRVFKPGQILYGSRRTYLKKVCVADFEGITANTTFVFETKDENVLLQRLLPFLMLGDRFTAWSIKHSKGSTNPYVLFGDLADYEFDLPPMDEQKKLAELLWAANDLKESYKKAITATDEMLKAKFREMFGDAGDDSSRGGAETLSLPANNAKWPMVCLGAIGRVCMCKRVLASQTKRAGDVPFYKISTFGGVADSYISYEHYAEFKHKYSYPKKGDVLLSAAGTIGRCVVYNGEPAYFQDSNIVWIDNDETKVTNPFLFVCYRYISWQTTKGGIIERLYNENIRKTKIPLPPLSLQREFVAIADKAESAKANLKKSIAAIDQVMKGLING